MAAIDAALGRAVGGAGGLVLLVGEAGVGKSRLVREARTRALSVGATVLFGRASDVASPAPFRPLAEALLSGFATRPDLEREALAPFAVLLGAEVPDELLAMVTNSAEGVPLVVEELLATLADERILVDEKSRTWRIRGEVVPACR